MNKQQKTAGIILIFILVASVLFLGFNFTPASVLSVNQINLDASSASIVNGKVVGSFWVVTLTVDMTESYTFLRLDDTSVVAQTSDGYIIDQLGTYYVDGQEVRPSTTIQATITPVGTPSYNFALQTVQNTVTPKTYGTVVDGGSGQYLTNHREDTTEQYTTAANPFTVTSKDLPSSTYGVVDSQYTIQISKIGGYGWNTDPILFSSKPDQTKTFEYSVPDNPNTLEDESTQKILVKQLGMLATSVTGPDFTNGIKIFDTGRVYQNTGTLQSVVQYDPTGTVSNSFSNYWFGPSRWPNGNPNVPAVNTQYGPRLDLNYGNQYSQGWSLTGNTEADPQSPDLTNFYGYLSSMPLQKISDNPNVAGGLNVYGEGYELVGNNLKVYTDYAPSSVIQIWISTELADTMVYQPAIEDFEITDYSWENNRRQRTVEVGETAFANLDVKNTGLNLATYEVSYSVSPSSVANYVQVSPLQTVQISGGMIKTVTFSVVNLGVSNVPLDFWIEFHVKDALGLTEKTCVLSGTLQTSFVPPQYTLTVLTEGYGSTSPLPGTYYYEGGTQIVVQAYPNLGFAFEKFRVNNNVVVDNPYTLVMNQDYIVVAVFNDPSEPDPEPQPQTCVLTVASNPSGITFSINVVSGQQTTPKTYVINKGESVSITMPETFVSGEIKDKFVKWEDGSTDLTRVVVVDSDMTVSATYEYESGGFTSVDYPVELLVFGGVTLGLAAVTVFLVKKRKKDR